MSSSINFDPLNQLDTEEVKNLMEEWFRNHFEDPAERTPYESREGGYQWIWGGPYNANEVLTEKFGSIVHTEIAEIIKELASKLNRECFEWASAPSTDDYDEYFYDLYNPSQNGSAEQKLRWHLEDIIKLLEVDLPNSQVATLRRLLYANVIASLEAYFADFVMQRVISDPDVLRRLVETTPEFKERKLTLSEVFKANESILDSVKKHLSEMIWHRLDKVSAIFKDALQIEFPKGLGPLYLAIKKRHDIVHRNGFNSEGQPIEIYKENISGLIETVEGLVNHIELENATKIFTKFRPN